MKSSADARPRDLALMAHGSRHPAFTFFISICHRLPGMAAAAFRDAPQSAKRTQYACRPLKCSTLIPSKTVDDKSTNDCSYRNGNEWWVDYVAGSLLLGATSRLRSVSSSRYLTMAR